MHRRKFLASMLALPAMPVLLQSCNWLDTGLPFPVYLRSDRKTAHRIFDGKSYLPGEEINTETLITGAGIAGLSAALNLPHTDYLLCELSDRPGGTSASLQHNGLHLAQGAHYDLEYPAGYGKDVLRFLERSGLIEYQHWKESWTFTDQRYVIPHGIKNHCYDHGTFREDVLPQGQERTDFFRLIEQFGGKLIMPTRMISPELHYLGEITFREYLQKEIQLSEKFYRGLDYHMLDDWGGTTRQVSALAGIHYFKCRPYYSQVNQLFSPPMGNDYFVQEFAKRVPAGNLKLSTLVHNISREGDTWVTRLLDVKAERVHTCRSKNVIYAGQKHALKFVLPEYFPLFENHTYAPWLVLNFVLDKPLPEYGYWQNEMLVEDISFLGFINSAAQHRSLQEKQVLTAYYCLPHTSRRDLVNLEKNQEAVVLKTLEYLNKFLKTDLTDRIASVHLNAMGHAMPIPGTGYLFRDQNQLAASRQLAFAGVDHHRLPLFFEAVDSGIQAVESLYGTPAS